MSVNIDPTGEMQNRIITTILHNITTNQQINRNTSINNDIIIQILILGIGIGVALFFKYLYSRFNDRIFSKKPLMAPDILRGERPVPIVEKDVNGKSSLEERIALRVKAILEMTAEQWYKELKDQRRFFEEWNQRIEDRIIEADKKKDALVSELNELKIDFAQHLGYARAKDEEFSKALDKDRK